jgi:hypothetical protein
METKESGRDFSKHFRQIVSKSGGTLALRRLGATGSKTPRFKRRKNASPGIH